MIRLLRGLFSRIPVLAGDLTVSYLDAEDVWGWGGVTHDADVWAFRQTLIDDDYEYEPAYIDRITAHYAERRSNRG